MSDIKTELRELSVAVTVALLIKGHNFDAHDLYNPQCFYHWAHHYVEDSDLAEHDILQYHAFTPSLKRIIDNGYKLGQAIYHNPHFIFSSDDEISWCGNQTQSGTPVDIRIGNYGFSLKEESYILKNMGLYELLNLLTNSNRFSRGLKIFEEYALEEYNAWFLYSWQKLLEYIHTHNGWEMRWKTHCACISEDAGKIVFHYDDNTEELRLSNLSSIHEYLSLVSGTYREKVVAKWINKFLSKDSEYLRLKKICSEKAGTEVCQIIQDNFSPVRLPEFFRFEHQEYYYAKTTALETTIMRVPSIEHTESEFTMLSCEPYIPVSQLNLIFTFKNIATGKLIKIRNECRFSHGQFNGNPEAKQYLCSDTPISNLYLPL